jgi:hypothetical protein
MTGTEEPGSVSGPETDQIEVWTSVVREILYPLAGLRTSPAMVMQVEMKTEAVAVV